MKAPPSPEYTMPGPESQSSHHLHLSMYHMFRSLTNPEFLTRADDDDEHLAPADPAAVAYSADQDHDIAYRPTARRLLNRTSGANTFLSEKLLRDIPEMWLPLRKRLCPDYSWPENSRSGRFRIRCSSADVQPSDEEGGQTKHVPLGHKRGCLGTDAFRGTITLDYVMTQQCPRSSSYGQQTAEETDSDFIAAKQTIGGLGRLDESP
ncbi:hypothetical protein Tco_0655602 [Tanacetum coccineum]|uniref:Uncharacterized protein n=1 Tax=Tanacetum coccineum TaxID=301880 RepID=A0ABQ4X707_9ASTR